mmetsp:Transcript_25355/g.45926  ORF Transcript_25355/g.45926 Transcript_25355/m.45926 type:complete len:948 (+) Transcript_25355:20-2863(+)|eukprot:CAMPEP_0197664198 /NCGR_PEP_ID=MMETSP1338-20131121/58487_1 /TAXON_ID=43686 ORGANISM="Pelagodinium beii, Strain RCC1491" /NCGR_SAMPLE_ID=MMETSP1338 /ASSEMBLY_ACC=CAM_ASM_000754 /LENGTH=947 /DNA_ID=CAMNT_0043242783 /DNA_START=20 /DNA_END=2863 /DNA_ORIENTATION=-
MDITVKEVEELPAHTFISVRYGDSRKQGPFRAGEAFSFSGGGKGGSQLPKAFTLDVFRKVGTKQVSVAGITAMGGSLRHDDLEIPSLDIQGDPVKTSIEASLRSGASPAGKGGDGPKMKQVAAEKARTYLEQHNVQSIMQEMFAHLLEQKPKDPLAFMSDFIERKRDEAEAAEGADEAIDFSQEPGLGAEALPGFGEGQALPDLSKHSSIVTDVLRRSPELYAELADQRTSTGVSLASCVKAGVDFPGHPLVKVSGAYAGDAESYELYKGVLDPVIAALHPGWSPELFGQHNRHPLDSNPAKLTKAVVDSSEGKYAVFASLEVRRNFSGLPFPNCCSMEQRRTVETILTNSEVKGSYLPLRGSQSFEEKPGGMALHQEERLRSMGMLFSEPDSQMKLAAGFGRHWPDARGVFVGDAPGLLVWCNEEDHLRFFVRQQGVDLKQLLARLTKAVASVEGAAKIAGYEFCSSKRLGYLTADPVRLGCSLKATVSLKLPCLSDSVDVPELCRSLELQCSSGGAAASGLWHVHSSDCLAISEVDLLNITVQGCKRLVALEQRLENGEPVFDALPGLGPELPPGVLPDSGSCPRRMPDISTCKSVVAACLRNDSGIYMRLRALKTEGGIGFGRCIRGALDRRSNGAALSTGLMAGDEECLDTFKELFDVVLARLPSLASKATSLPLDPSEPHCSWVRADLRRNISGIKLATCCSREERREAERLLVKAMSALSTPGEYLPLHYSQSSPLCPGGVSLEVQSRLLQDGSLFSQPRDTAALDAGVGRDWPDARGAFKLPSSAAGAESIGWVNESDHLLLRSRMQGADLSAACKHAQGLAEGIEAALKADSRGFALHQQFGFVSLDALHLGSGLQLTAALHLTKLSSSAEFPQICAGLGLAEIWRDGLNEVSCYPAPGLSAEELLERAQQNFGVLVHLEKILAEGGQLDAELTALGLA